MPSKKKAAIAAETIQKPKKAAAKAKTEANRAPTKKPKARKLAKAPKAPAVEVAELISSKVVYQGPLFRVLHDKLIEPSGKHNERDVIRHNGSVVILAIDSSKSKKN